MTEIIILQRQENKTRQQVHYQYTECRLWTLETRFYSTLVVVLCIHVLVLYLDEVNISPLKVVQFGISKLGYFVKMQLRRKSIKSKAVLVEATVKRYRKRVQVTLSDNPKTSLELILPTNHSASIHECNMALIGSGRMWPINLMSTDCFVLWSNGRFRPS